MVLGGCTSTVTMPATELPTLSTQSVQASAEWPEVTTVEGEPQKIIGTIETIRIQGANGGEPIYQPFAARINGPYLEVFGPTGPRGFPLAQDLTVTVEYNDAKKRRNAIGGALIGAGVPVFITGAVSMKAAVDIFETGGVFGFIGIFPFLYGIIGIGGGIGMVIPGIVLVATDPAKPTGGNTAVLQPKLNIRPGGVDLTMQF